MSYFPEVGLTSNVPNRITTGNITALNGVMSVLLLGQKSCVVMAVGTWVGTLVVESSNDEGTTWLPCLVQPASIVTTYEATQAVASFTTNGVYAIYATTGVTSYRVRASLWTSGTANITLTTTENPPVNLQPNVVGDFYPISTPELTTNNMAPARVDSAGNLMSRSAVLTDEGSFYEPFAGVTLASQWTASAGTGGSISVANSLCTIVSGTTATNQCFISRLTDYPPLTFVFKLNVSQRIANQDIYFGYGDNITTPSSDTMFARFHFTGTDNTKVCCETQSSGDTNGNEGLNVQIIIPFGAVSSEYLFYKIENDGTKVKFSIGRSLDNMVVLATRSSQVPNPYTQMYQRVRFLNGTTPATTTTINVDTITCNNYNIVDIQSESGRVTSIIQNVTASTVNSSTANLASSATFTGATEFTLGVAGLQVSLKTDQNCTMYLDQSSDGTNWDITDTFNYIYSLGGNSWTIQAVASYFRVRVTNVGASTTTYLRLQTALCPIVEAVPRTVDAAGNFKVCIKDMESWDTGWKVKNSPMGEMRVSEHTKLVGENFEGALDTNFWAATNTGTGANAVTGGQATLSTGATADSTALLQSVRIARYIGSYPNYFRAIIRCPAVTGANVRRWGAFDVNNGFFFEYDGTTLKVVARKATTDTAVASGSFNGTNGAVYTLGTNITTYEIYWTNTSAWFFIGDTFIHKISGLTTPSTATIEFKIGLNIVNSAGNTNNNTLEVRVASISRIGPDHVATIGKFLNANATTTLKTGAGILHSVINNDNVGTCTIWDNTAGSGTQIANLDLARALGTNVFDYPFYIGLTVVIAGGGIITFTYE